MKQRSHKFETPKKTTQRILPFGFKSPEKISTPKRELFPKKKSTPKK